ncbi:hypothetical protein O181_021325 [Austropuccinia psidii MF-1]|uniref:Uncharacterized protein n=1 Tax=Austropuccinia psidii MF-1 TaxID=1389203 RepID=A0A9Q3CEG1_9BASI|nr:hypothetical protein [Austropuccinia psidii MF-1]
MHLEGPPMKKIKASLNAPQRVLKDPLEGIKTQGIQPLLLQMDPHEHLNFHPQRATTDLLKPPSKGPPYGLSESSKVL